MEEKSANQLWRESGTSLPFAQWLQREKDKGRFIVNKKVQDALESMKQTLGLNEQETVLPTEKKNVFGLSKTAIYFAIALVAGAVAYKIYKKNK